MTSCVIEDSLPPRSWIGNDSPVTEETMPCEPCVARLPSRPDQLGAQRAAVMEESEPVVSMTQRCISAGMNTECCGSASAIREAGTGSLLGCRCSLI